MDEKLQAIHSRIDRVDDQLLELLLRRMQETAQEAACKQAGGQPLIDTERERQTVNRLTQSAGEDMEHAVKLIYQTLFDVSKARQAELLRPDSPLLETLRRAAQDIRPRMPNRAAVACQGTEGAYSQKACVRMFAFPEIRYMKTFSDVFDAVENGVCPYGVLPIENSTAGSVTQVYDLMEKHHFFIVRAARQRIDHRLLALPGVKMEEIREVVSHEQALRQCGAFLAAHPSIRVTPMANTAVAAAYVSRSGRGDLAAIASQDCEQLYALETLDDSISDAGNNYTRFICIAKDLALYEGANKISLMLSAAHRPGSLYRLLSHIAVDEINLTKLESRPIPGKDFEFRFFFDIEASIREEKTRLLIQRLKNDADQFVFLGNYEEIR